MKDPFEEYAKKVERRGERRGEKIGEKNTLIQNIKKLMKNMDCTIEQAFDVLEIKEKDRKSLISQIR